MKRYMLIISILLVFTTVLTGCNFSRVGTDKYYVQITKDGERLKDKLDDGYTNYQYKSAGFDKNGKEKTMEFKADKNLRKDAFLRIYYSEEKGVKSWEEVEKNELPTKVKEKLGIK